MPPTDVPTPIVPDIDAIRHAIRDADERARLLRRLLRAAMRLHVHLTTADRIPAPADRKESDRG